MKKLFTLILAAAMLLTLAGCSAEPETTYILTEWETTMSDGTLRKTVNHYDENWTLTGSTAYVGDEVEMEVAYELDDHGSLSKATYTMYDTVVVEEYVFFYD